MTNKKYTRLNLASNQLEAAISLFLSGGDRFSVITLAGAADVILSRLVLNTGEENFTDLVLKTESNKLENTRETLGRDINDLFFINQIKHLDPDDDGYIDLNPEECAIGAILKTLPNHIKLTDQHSALITSFLTYIKKTLDPTIYNTECDPNWVPPRNNR